MTRRHTLISVLIFTLFSAITPAQAIMEENFQYTTGRLSVVSESWDESPTGSLDIEVSEGNLSYDGYSLSNIGNKIYLNGGASGRSGVKTNFQEITGNGNGVYISFLLKVISTEDLDLQTTNGDYLANLKFGTSTNRVYIYIKKGTTDSNFQLGTSKIKFFESAIY